ncbi:uncharacterized protein LOC118421801 [Branchiostoma floridae]|uniref:Uncharacterized protein LOC118421801 n=1 Tax=Branchiostoma floridae TaxID=7739 RepID=A0A9J7LLP3_BRAFL|nr:uncharacterized protein LOC118421801 [Branchiostoma floridae]
MKTCRTASCPPVVTSHRAQNNNPSKMEVLTTAEELVNEAVGTKTIRRYLNAIARVLIVLAFMDDIYNQQYSWWSNVHYFAQIWGLSRALVGPILGLLVTAEFFGTLLILTQQRFEVGCGALVCGTVFQVSFSRSIVLVCSS